VGLADYAIGRDTDSSTFARARDPGRPLIALVGIVNAGKSAFLNRFINERVGVVANREHSSHAVFLGWGERRYLGLKFTNGEEREVSRQEFEAALSFDKHGHRRDDIQNGIVRIPDATLKKIDFVDLPGLFGRHAAELDEQVLSVAAKCQMAFVFCTRMRGSAVGVAAWLARQSVSLICMRTKGDLLYLTGSGRDQIPFVRVNECESLLDVDVIAPVLSVTSTDFDDEAGKLYAIVPVERLREHLEQLVTYYQISTLCSWVARHPRPVVGKMADPRALAVDLHRQVAGALCLSVEDRQQASLFRGDAQNCLADFLHGGRRKG
jgi:50S ribosome-binding GTPase